jgi:hypothetical protein
MGVKMESDYTASPSLVPGLEAGYPLLFHAAKGLLSLECVSIGLFPSSAYLNQKYLIDIEVPTIENSFQHNIISLVEVDRLD